MRALLAIAVAAVLLRIPATAAEPPKQVDTSRIEGAAGAQISGVASINLAAGRGNAQANLAAIGLAGGASAVSVSGEQTTMVAAGDALRGAVASMGGAALSSGNGLLSVNQAAGAANAQINLFALGRGATAAALLQTVDVTALAAVVGDGGTGPGVPLAPPLREARIEGAALASPKGVLQLNQTAGVGNASANAIVLQIPGGIP